MTLQSKQSNIAALPSDISAIDGVLFSESAVTNSEALFALVAEKVDTIFKNQEALPDISSGNENKFFSEDNLPSPERFSKAKLEMLASARRDVRLLLAELKYKAGKTEILLGTKQEQADFLLKIENCLLNPGMFTQKEVLRGMFETIIVDEISNGISRIKNFESVFQAEGFPINGKDSQFNFPAIEQNSTLIPMDIHLAFESKHTVRDALDRIQKQYRSRFNAIILITSGRVPIGIIKIDELQKHTGETLLQDVPINYSGPFGTLGTPGKEMDEIMFTQGVNIFPIAESKTRVLIGYITHETIALQETRVYLPKLQAQVGGQILKEEIRGGIL